MKTTIKSLLKGFDELPEKKFPSGYFTPQIMRSYFLALYGYSCGLISHLLFILIFVLCGIKILALFNIISVSLWGVALLLHRKGYFWQGYLSMAIELISHAAICTVVIGWDTGFQYYLIAFPAAVFLVHWKIPVKVLIAYIYTFAFMAINYYASVSVPYLEISPLYISAFNYGNILFAFTGFAGTGYIYYAIVKNTEEKLEKEHKRTNEALMERNTLLNRLNQELADAAEYVRNILPSPIKDGSIRTTWRFIPSTSLGGDAFGYHKVDKDYFAVYLIDVSGHGVGAALLSASVINVLRSQSLPNTDFKDPSQVLQALNLAFPSDANKDMFFTIWYGVFNKKGRELTYASAGHPPAILCKEDPSCECHVNLLKTPNFVLGGIECSIFVKDKCTVPEGNSLYIFSDGVYEVEKSDGTRWRFGEFVNFVKTIKNESQPVLDRLYQYVRRIGKSENLEDDFTIVEVIFS